MLKKSLMIGVVAILTLVAFSAVMGSDDSEAAVSAVEKYYEVDGIFYDICTNDANHSYYGSDGAKIAFVSGDSKNLGYNGTTLTIPATVTYGTDEYTVVGIRASAFQASRCDNWDKDHPENNTKETIPLLNITEVTFPKTLVAIGVETNYEITGKNGYTFSKCLNLKTINIPEESSLKFIGLGTFQDTAIEELDLSNCSGVTIYERTSADDYAYDGASTKLKSVDIRNATDVGRYAFRNCDNIETIYMPTSGSISIEAFTTSEKTGQYTWKSWEFYDNEGNKITDPTQLLNQVFKVEIDPVTGEKSFKSTYKVTYEMNYGVEPSESNFREGEALPIPTKDGYDFYKWYDVANGKFLDDGKMPKGNVTLSAYWAVEVPDPVSYDYDGDSHTPYEDNAVYTVSGDKTKKDAGKHYATLDLIDDYNVWAGNDHTTRSIERDWVINKAKITVSGITAEDKVYNGNLEAVLNYLGAVLTGILTGDDVTLESATGVFGDKNVGENKTVTIGNYVLGGTDAGNYVLAAYTMALTASITPATITGDIEQDGTLTYDGTPLRADVYITLVSVADEKITITYSLAADGVYSLAVPSFTEVGDHAVYYRAEAPNHEVKTGSFTVTISAPHNADVEGGDHALLLLIGGIAAVAGAMLVAPFIFGRP